MLRIEDEEEIAGIAEGEEGHDEKIEFELGAERSERDRLGNTCFNGGGSYFFPLLHQCQEHDNG